MCLLEPMPTSSRLSSDDGASQCEDRCDDQRRGDQQPPEQWSEERAEARHLGHEAGRVAVPLEEQGDEEGQVHEGRQHDGGEAEKGGTAGGCRRQMRGAQCDESAETKEQRRPRRRGGSGIDADKKSGEQGLGEHEAATKRRK